MFFYREVAPSGDAYLPNVSLLLKGNTTLTTQPSNQYYSIKDDSNNNFRIGRYGNTSINNITYKYGQSSLYFDGNGDYLKLDSYSIPAFNFATGDFTIECWIYANNTNCAIVDRYGGSNAYQVYIDGSGYLQFWNLGLVLSSNNQISTNTWHHIAVSRESNTLRLFIDGVLNGTTTDNTNYTNSIRPLFLGAQGAGAYAFQGYIDDLRITKGFCRYNSGFLPPSSELTLTGDTQSANVSLLLRGNTYSVKEESSNNFVIYEFGNNAKISDSNFKYGSSSLTFYGNGDYLGLDSSLNSSFDFGTGDFTIECWIYTHKNNTVILDRYGVAGGYQVYIDNAGYFQFWNTELVLSTNNQISLDNWHHVAVSRQSNTLRLFIDGVLNGTTTDNTNYTSAVTLSIGAQVYSRNSTYDFSGEIDDFRITKGVARYTANFTPAVIP